MATPGAIWINSKEYPLLADNLLPSGRRGYVRSLRPSAPSDPGRVQTATWKLSGPLGQSRESPEGFLGHDYSDNIDTRNKDLLTSAAARNAVTLTGLDPPTTGGGTYGGDNYGGAVYGPAYAAGNTQFIDEDRGELFFHRDKASTQVDPSDMSVVQTVIHPANVDGAAVWQDRGYLGLGIDAAMVRRVKVTSTGSKYEPVLISGIPIGAKALTAGSDRLWMVTADNQEMFSNHARYSLDDLISVSCSFAVGDQKIPATGIGTLGVLTMIGNELGAGSFTDAGKPVKMVEPVKGHRSANNGVHFANYEGWLYFTTDVGLYAWNGGLTVNPVGPEADLDFEGAIDGRPTALWDYKDSLWCAYLTPGGNTYILRGDFKEGSGGTADTGRLDWYPFRLQSSTEVHVIGSTGQRTNPTIIWGEGTNAAYATLGRRGRDIADANYVFGTDGGTWFGSTMMRNLHMVKNLRYARFITENCDATNTWQLAVSVDEGAYVNVGAAVTTNGLQTVFPVSGSPPTPLSTVNGHTFKFRLTQVADDPANPPQVRGFLTAVYDELPDMIQEVTVIVNLGGVPKSKTLFDQLEVLADDGTASPVTVRLPDDPTNTDLYGFVVGVDEVRDIKGDGIQSAIVRLHIWETA